MDGMDSSPGVMILAATNRPWALDSAFLRRFTGVIFIDLGGFEARVAQIQGDIIKRYMKKQLPFLQSKLCEITVDNSCENDNRNWCEMFGVFRDKCLMPKISSVNFFNADKVDIYPIGTDINKPPEPIRETDEMLDGRMWAYSKCFRELSSPTNADVLSARESLIRERISPDQIDSSKAMFTSYDLRNNDPKKPVNLVLYPKYYFTNQAINLINYIKGLKKFKRGSFSDIETSRFLDLVYGKDEQVTNYRDLVIMIHFISDLIGPSLDSYRYSYVNGSKRTYEHALSSFGYSGSDIGNVVSEFFSNIASQVLFTSIDKPQNFEKTKCNNKVCEIDDEVTLDKRLCLVQTNTGKREFSNTRTQSGSKMNYSYLKKASNGEMYDLYSRMRLVDWFEALRNFTTTTGNLAEYCSYIGYEKSGRSEYVNLESVCPTKSRLNSLQSSSKEEAE
jgi:hypothetical protein